MDMKLLERNLILPDIQIQAKFKHAEHFGVKGNYNKQSAQLFKEKIIAHVNDPNTIAIAGKYTRGGVRDVVHYYNPKTEINVMKDKQGKFISGWKLGDEQRPIFEKTGKLGGV